MHTISHPVVIVAGLRGDDADHWQSHLARDLPSAVVVDSFDRSPTDLDGRIADLDDALASLDEPATVVAHSAGVLVTVHWAHRHGRVLRLLRRRRGGGRRGCARARRCPALLRR